MRSIRTFGAVILVALAMVIGAMSFSSSASASSPISADHAARARDGYGAIALSIDGAGGTSKNYPTEAGAYRAAVKACKRVSDKPGRCVKFLYVRNQCGAVWFKYNAQGEVNTKAGSKPHAGFSRNLDVAIRRARNGHAGGKIIKTCT